jgi:hypothetical protein
MSFHFVLLFFPGVVVSHPNPEAMKTNQYHNYNQLMATNFQTWETGPNFDTKLPQNVTAINGKTAQLICRVLELGNKTVRTQYFSFETLQLLAARWGAGDCS